MNAMQLERIGEAVLLRMRAGKANAMGPAWLERMEALLDEALAARARALVITGYEAFFSAGLDLPTLDGLDDRAMGSFMSGFSRTMLRIFELPMPVVAAVNGHAIAGGCVLALQADVRIGAASDFRMGLNEVQLGIGLPAVVLEALRAQVPAASLLPIALEGRLFSPEGDRAFVAKKVVAAGQSPPPGWRCALGEAGRRRYAFHGAASRLSFL